MDIIKPDWVSDDGMVMLYNRDCLEVLPTLGAGSAEFCFTDPPYNVGKVYGKLVDDSREDGEYLEWCRAWIEQLGRVSLRQCIYAPRKYLRRYWNILGDSFKQVVLTWTPEGAIRGGFVNQHASLLVNAKPVQRTKDVWANAPVLGQGWFFRENTYGHPGYTSSVLTKRAIQSFSNGAVIDPFLGTGSTGVASVQLGRRFVGVEICEEYYLVAKRRIQEAQLQGRLL